jgi:hypothetical protein
MKMQQQQQQHPDGTTIKSPHKKYSIIDRKTHQYDKMEVQSNGVDVSQIMFNKNIYKNNDSSYNNKEEDSNSENDNNSKDGKYNDDSSLHSAAQNEGEKDSDGEEDFEQLFSNLEEKNHHNVNTSKIDEDDVMERNALQVINNNVHNNNNNNDQEEVLLKEQLYKTPKELFSYYSKDDRTLVPIWEDNNNTLVYFNENDTYHDINSKLVTNIHSQLKEQTIQKGIQISKRRQLIEEYVKLNLLRFPLDKVGEMVVETFTTVGK